MRNSTGISLAFRWESLLFPMQGKTLYYTKEAIHTQTKSSKVKRENEGFYFANLKVPCYTKYKGVEKKGLAHI